MFIVFDDRPSDSPLVERVWRSHSVRAGVFSSMASCHWGMVVTRYRGRTYFTIRGPETRATPADCPSDGEWMGIHFTLGTFMPAFVPGGLRDRNDLHLPGSGRTFLLDGTAWEYPSFDNAEVFVARLLKQGLIAAAPAIQRALDGDPWLLSRRSFQRQFLHATGMTPKTMAQIERARQAVRLLTGGHAAAEVAHELGYYDQAHLTRSLRRYAGFTPGTIQAGSEQLSLLYNTRPPAPAILEAGAEYLRRSEDDAPDNDDRETGEWNRYPHGSCGRDEF